ncbi:MAG TPA: SMC-Scp complex subunit ScpB [Candidatus Polarisedimenticolaceae bacterium]|nr:SMC-Scp complex subunit ScpB [Candidatus Polarisedimenticolaceae bacterium]
MSEQDDLTAAVEAVLFAAGEPVHPKEIASSFEGPDEQAVRDAIEALAARYAEGTGGLVVEQVAGAYRLATKPAVGALVRQFFRQRNRTRLSPAGLETLAIVAYRQPATVPEIQSIRGVDPTGALKSLLEKKLVRILGRKKVVGNPLLYGTTKQFLVHFGLNRLEDLPSIEEFDQFVGALDEPRPPVEMEPFPEAEAGGEHETDLEPAPVPDEG